MHGRLLKIIEATNSRYCSPEEQQDILDYANSLALRLKTASIVERNEEEIVAQVIEKLKRLYPRFQSMHDRGWEKGFRDMQLVIRYIVQSMLLDDSDAASEKLYVWLRTILSSFGLTPQFVRDTYSLVKDNLRQRLPPDSYELMAPFVDRAIADLTDFPEPAVPAV